MTWTVEHDWRGLILIKDLAGRPIATLEKHASGTPGSGIPSDTHAKLQAGRAQMMAASPDLIAALKEALPYVQRVADTCPTQPAGVLKRNQAEKALATIQAALKQAEG